MSTGAARVGSQITAGAIVTGVLASPALLIWWSGANGSLGDLSEIELLGVGLAIAAVSGAAAAGLMGRALALAERDPLVGRLDPWAALFVGVTVLAVAVAVVPAVGLLLLLPDEDTPLGARVHWLEAVWVGGFLLASSVAVVAARAVLRREHRRRAPAVAPAEPGCC